MNFHYHIIGSHVHVRVMMNGALLGILTFTSEEFSEVKDKAFESGRNSPIYAFHDEGAQNHTQQAA